MSLCTDFFDIVCQSKRVWIPFFYINAVLLVLNVVGVAFSTPGEASHIIAIATLPMLIPPFVCMIWFFKICRERPK